MDHTLSQCVEGLLDAWYDRAENYTCHEAELLAELIGCTVGRTHAERFLEAHAEGDDDPHNDHYKGD